MDNKYIRDPDTLALMESNKDSLLQSRLRRKILKDKDNMIQDLQSQVSSLQSEFDQLKHIVNGLINNGTTSK